MTIDTEVRLGSPNTFNRKRLASFLYPKYSYFIDAINRNALVADWLRRHSTSFYLLNREDIYRYVFATLVENDRVDVLEFGVSEGNSLTSIINANQNSQSRFFGFDTFEGLPEDWRSGWGKIPKQSYSTQGVPPVFDDKRVSLEVGLYQETLDEFLRDFTPKGQIIIHVDCDLYSSSLYVLTRCDKLRKYKPLILMDDFTSPLHVFRAFVDYVSAFAVDFEFLAASGRYYDQVCVRLL